MAENPKQLFESSQCKTANKEQLEKTGRILQDLRAEVEGQLTSKSALDALPRIGKNKIIL